jgi:hypothetical protein
MKHVSGRLDRGHERAWPRPTLAALLAFWVLLMTSAIGWPGIASHPAYRAERYILHLAPPSLILPRPGVLEHPLNFGFRCTLVDAAAVLNLYGADLPQALLALDLSDDVDYSASQQGPPWWAYVPMPGKRPLLDQAIEAVAAVGGLRVSSHTYLGLSFARAAQAIAAGHPVILNVIRTPDGTYDHSLLAYGEDTRDGRRLLLVLDPNSQQSYWVGPGGFWSMTLTSTFITPSGATGA